MRTHAMSRALPLAEVSRVALKQIQHSLFPELPRKPATARRRVPKPAPRRRRVPLWLAVYLPELSLESLLRGQIATPSATIVTEGGSVRIHSVNDAAAEGGVCAGMTLAAAWSVLPSLDAHERDVARERKMLVRLAEWATAFTPTVCIDEQCLLLEVRGSLRLFEGAACLRDRLREGIEQLGFHAQLAMAPSPRAALWFARAGHEVHVDDFDELPPLLGRLPLAVAGFDEKLLERVDGIGARRVGDIMRLPRDGFARRYSARVLRELDQALGRVPDVRCSVPPARRFSANLDLLYEISEVDRLLHPVKQLLVELDGYLRGTQQGVRRVQLSFMHRDRTMSDVVIGLASATRDAERIRLLVEQKLESFELPAPVLEVTLRSLEMSPLAGSDRALFAEQEEGADWPELVERLQVRLGSAAVSSIEQCADHRPERAWRHVAPGRAHESPGMAGRPQWLLETPRALRVQQGRPLMEGPLEMLAGPERIETGWWDEADVSRDYFIARDVHGRRLWVCREVKSGRWWLQGIYA